MLPADKGGRLGVGGGGGGGAGGDLLMYPQSMATDVSSGTVKSSTDKLTERGYFTQPGSKEIAQ